MMKGLALVFVLLVVAAPAQAATNLLTNGDFQGPYTIQNNFGSWQVVVNVQGWRFDFRNYIEFQSGATGTSGASRPDGDAGARWIELDVHGGDNQLCAANTLAYAPKGAYVLDYWYYSRMFSATSGMRVYVNGNEVHFHDGLPTAAGRVWEHWTYTVDQTVNGPLEVKFCQAGPADGLGALLTKVSLSRRDGCPIVAP